MPHGGGGGSHGGGSHSSHSSHSSSHHSGGGSHGGGTHRSSHHSYSGGGHRGGGGRGAGPRPHYRRRNRYFPGAHKYVYYMHNRPYYYYTDLPETESMLPSNYYGMVLKVLFTTFFLFPAFAVCIYIVFAAAVPKTKITEKYDASTVIEDQAEIFEDTEELETAMDAFLDKTGIAPAVITVNNEDWEDYYDSLELYAYDLYVNHFSDEYHFLIVYSEPEEADTAFNDWYWEYMAGDDTEKILTDSVLDDFTESLHSNLLANSRYTVDEAVADALTEMSGTCMESDISRDMVPRAVIGLIIIIAIFWLFFIAGRGKRKAMREATMVPKESEQLETKCTYCGGVYVRGTCTSCPHCGAPISLQ